MDQEVKGLTVDIRRIVEEAVTEYARKAAEAKEPAARAELGEERRRREMLERRLSEMEEESRRHRAASEEANRHTAIKAGLERVGVKKPEMAFRLVKDEVFRDESGDLYARTEQGSVPLEEYLTRFVAENPEFLPARIAGGSGASPSRGVESEGGVFDLSRIRPGMTAEEKQRARKEIARIAGKDFGDWL